MGRTLGARWRTALAASGWALFAAACAVEPIPTFADEPTEPAVVVSGPLTDGYFDGQVVVAVLGREHATEAGALVTAEDVDDGATKSTVADEVGRFVVSLATTAKHILRVTARVDDTDELLYEAEVADWGEMGEPPLVPPIQDGLLDVSHSSSATLHIVGAVGAAVAGAPILAANESAGILAEAVADEQGAFVVDVAGEPGDSLVLLQLVEVAGFDERQPSYPLVLTAPPIE